MSSLNNAVADHLEKIYQLLVLDEASPFQFNAFKNGAQAIRGLTDDVSKVNLKSVKGIGPSISAIINQFLAEGTSDRFKELSRLYPIDALTLTIVPGIGPKRALKFYREGVKTLDQLKEKADKGELETKLANAVKFAMSKDNARIPMPIALDIAEYLKEQVSKIADIEAVVICGSLRRRCETIKDIDLVACIADGSNRRAIFDEFIKLGDVLVSGEAKTSIKVSNNGVVIQCDLWLVDKGYFGSAIAYATGSKDHNVAIRTLAKSRGLTINEYGVFKEANNERLGGENETDIYDLLGLVWHEPEWREGSNLLTKEPKLITEANIKCDFHNHTAWSNDGSKTRSIEVLVAEAKERGYTSIAITDHSYSSHFKTYNDLSSKSVGEYIAKCREAEQKIGIKVLAGIECDILQDGTLQWPDDELKRLDFVLGAIHRSHAKDTTERYVSAIKTGLIHGLAHPTTRLFGSRPIPDMDWDKVFQAAKEMNVAMEINGGADRLDLPADLARKAMGYGLKMFLSSDSHSEGGMAGIKYALMLARKAGVEENNLFVFGK